MLKISFPHMGDYHMPIRRMLRDLFPQAEVFAAPPITQKTIALGARHSPDFVCSPFKYNMGNYIEALAAGANVIFQTGLGCRYGYYGEVQEQILRDLGYEFTFLCFSREKARLTTAYGMCKELNPNLTPSAFLHALLSAIVRIRIMDKLDFFLRERVGFEEQPGSFDKAKKALLSELETCDSIPALYRTWRRYWHIYQRLAFQIPQKPFRVGIVGELYTLMEPFSNHYLEKQLARAGIMASRKMSVTFLLFGKHDRLSLKKVKGYLGHTVGANGIDSVVQCQQYAQAGYDGILHIKSFGCTPELNAQPVLMNIGREQGIPILHLSFDTQTSETGLKTRMEAFIDMIKMKRDQSDEKNGELGRGRGFHLHQGRIH